MELPGILARGFAFVGRFLFLYITNLHGIEVPGFILGVGMFLFIFADIPFAVLSFVLMAKGRIDTPYKAPILILAILNLGVGLAAWYFLALVLQMP